MAWRLTPVVVLEIHGTADQNVPINGGVGSDGLNKEDYPPPVDAPFMGFDSSAAVWSFLAAHPRG